MSKAFWFNKGGLHFTISTADKNGRHVDGETSASISISEHTNLDSAIEQFEKLVVALKEINDDDYEPFLMQ